MGAGDHRHRLSANEATDDPRPCPADHRPRPAIRIGLTHGLLWVAFGLFAFVSMFRKPLRYLALRALGRDPGPRPQ